jgi:DNA-binding transcriptional LysR family regulator
MASLAFEGYGSTIVPTTAVPGWLKGDFARIPITDLALRQVALARRRRAMLSASARAVADVLHDVIAAKGPKQRGVRVQAAPVNEDRAYPSH